MTELDELIAIERTLWTNNPVVYRDRLTADAVLVFAETGPISRDVAVAAIEQENAEGRFWAEVRFEAPRVRRIDEGVVLLHYRATARWQGDAASTSVLASSVYVRRDGEWRLAFHQQSAAPPG